jgi:hypothetical protein
VGPDYNNLSLLEKTMLKIGDKIKYIGCFGMDKTATVAKVTDIEIDTNGSKYGTVVKECSWGKINGRNAILSLDNGHWCWANQVVKDA